MFYSDNGSNLTGACKELKDVISSFKEVELRRFANQQGMEWKFTSAEAMVKSVKRATNNSIGTQALEFSVMLTVFFEVAQLVNSRPLGRHPNHPEEGSYLCPNDLLLGRSSACIPEGPFKDDASASKKYEFIQSFVKTFWKKWTRDYFPSLIVCRKWHAERQNV